MKSGKVLIVVALSLCLICSLAGCSGNGETGKDSVIDGFNDLLHYFSQYALTDEKDLKGEKIKGEDTYTGSYTAEYDDFSGIEYLFGGTGLERESGNELAVTYKLQIISGSAKLFWMEGEEEHIIADASGGDTFSVTLSSKDNYIAVKGEKFKGSLNLSVD